MADNIRAIVNGILGNYPRDQVPRRERGRPFAPAAAARRRNEDDNNGEDRAGYYDRRQYHGLQATGMGRNERIMSWNNDGHGPKQNSGNRGRLTGIARPKWPRTVRPYTTRTRQHIVGNRPTGILDNQYDKNIVGSHSVPPFIPPHASAGQRGATTITRHVPSLQPGSHHFLFKG